jgi:hypothetical protein
MDGPAPHPENHQHLLREAFARHTHALLAGGTSHESDWVAARSFLADRAFDLRHWDSLPLGFFPDASALRERLLHDGFAAEELRASGLLGDERLQGRLVGPICDPERRIVSFWAKDPHNEQSKTLYLSRDWKADTPLFGLDVALPAVLGGCMDLLVVEDILDAILLRASGLANVAAVGGLMQEMGPARWERLAELGIHRATLGPDRNGTCPSAVIAVENAARARTAPAVYVLPPEILPEWMGPAAVVRSLGPEALMDLLARQRIHGLRYKALRLAAAHRQRGPWAPSAKHAALREAAAFYAGVHQRMVPQLDAFFLPALLDELELGWDDRPGCHERLWLEESPEAAEGIDALPVAKAIAPLQAVSIEVRQAPRESGLFISRQVLEVPFVGPVLDMPLPPKEDDSLAAILVEAAEPTRRSTRVLTAPSDFCEFHQCQRKVCLCWD